MSIIIAIVFAFGSLICYASYYAVARADRMKEQYWEEHKNEFHGQNRNNKQNC